MPDAAVPVYHRNESANGRGVGFPLRALHCRSLLGYSFGAAPPAKNFDLFLFDQNFKMFCFKIGQKIRNSYQKEITVKKLMLLFLF